MKSSAPYAVVTSLAAPLLRLMLGRRVRRGKEVAARLGERFGIAGIARPAGRLVWFHAASVGETLSLLPVIEALEGRLHVLLTTGTVTSAALAAQRLPGVIHQFAPLDVPRWVGRFLAHWRPDCAVFVESEIWPATLRLLDARGVPRLLLNGSLSGASAARWGWWTGLSRELLGGFRAVHAQSAADAGRLIRLGAHDVLEWGNLKFAAPLLPVDEAMLDTLRRQLQGPVWLAASTHAGEEEMVIAAHRLLAPLLPGLVTVIAPRHPARGAEVAALAAGSPAASLAVARRSLGQPMLPGIYIADTLGELGLFYRLVTCALVGGSLVEVGGHNLTEPARLGVAVLTGPHTGEIGEQMARLRAVGAVMEVRDAASLAEAVGRWLADPPSAAAAGARALRAFYGMQALPARLAGLIMDQL